MIISKIFSQIVSIVIPSIVCISKYVTINCLVLRNLSSPLQVKNISIFTSVFKKIVTIVFILKFKLMSYFTGFYLCSCTFSINVAKIYHYTRYKTSSSKLIPL